MEADFSMKLVIAFEILQYHIKLTHDCPHLDNRRTQLKKCNSYWTYTKYNYIPVGWWAQILHQEEDNEWFCLALCLLAANKQNINPTCCSFK